MYHLPISTTNFPKASCIPSLVKIGVVRHSRIVAGIKEPTQKLSSLSFYLLTFKPRHYNKISKQLVKRSWTQLHNVDTVTTKYYT